MVQLACPRNYVSGTGTQISGSVSNIKKNLAPVQPPKIPWAPGSTALAIVMLARAHFRLFLPFLPAFSGALQHLSCVNVSSTPWHFHQDRMYFYHINSSTKC